MAYANNKLTREALEGMKRVDIQKICKDYGVRANMKTEALIELLLDTIHNSNMAPLHRPPPRPPVQQPVTRRLSTRSRTASQATTIRTRGSSSRSIIINGEVQQPTGTSSTTTTQVTSARARKAKETQLSLGVGRPTAASSARSRTLTRSLRLRASRSSRLAQEAIAEEETQPTETNITPAPNTNPSPQRNQTHRAPNNNEIMSRLEALESLTRETGLAGIPQSMKEVSQQVAWLRQVYQDRENAISRLQSELDDQRNEIAILRTQAGRVVNLEEQLACLFGSTHSSQSSQQYAIPPAAVASGSKGKGIATRRVSVPLGNSNTNTIIPVQSSSNTGANTLHVAEIPGPPEMTLGKRLREPTTSSIETQGSARRTGEEATSRLVLRPGKKRPRIEDGSEATAVGSSQPGNESPSPLPTPSMVPSECDGTPAPSGASGSRVPSAGSPPPIAQLPEYFGESLDEQLLQRKDPFAGINPADFNLASDVANFSAALGGDGFFPFTFMQGATTSTPRATGGVIYPGLFDAEEPFSPGSALREQNDVGVDVPSFNPFGTRRIPSKTMPRTPTQPNNHIATDIRMNTRAPHPGTILSSPMTALEEELFMTDRLAFDFDPATPRHHQPVYSNNAASSSSATIPMADAQTQHKVMQQQIAAGTYAPVAGTSMGVPLNFPAHIAATPMRPAKTRYGTEVFENKRFGDFGQAGVIGSAAWIAQMMQ